MSIADDPFFAELPKDSRDRIAEAESERESIVQEGDRAARKIVETFGRGMDPLGIDQMIYGDSQAVLAARQVQREALEKGNWRLFRTAITEWREWLKPDVEAFMAKLLGTWRLVYGPNAEIPEDLIRRYRAEMLRLRAASEPLKDAHAGICSMPQETAEARRRQPTPPDRESKEARAARRQARLAPLLEKEGVTINELESSAGLAKNTARKYWDGSTVRPRPGTRKKLAEALKVKPEKLPD
jgi:hypothetical protein